MAPRRPLVEPLVGFTETETRKHLRLDLENDPGAGVDRIVPFFRMLQQGWKVVAVDLTLTRRSATFQGPKPKAPVARARRLK